MSRLLRWKSLLAGLLITAGFLLLTHRGLLIYFTSDDVLNIVFLHGYGRKPVSVLVATALSVFTPEYRPVGGLYYRGLFSAFGLNPLPFRMVFYVLLLGNLALCAMLIRRLRGGWLTTAAGTLLFSFHPALASLYYNNGTVYDVLCFTFFALAAAVYLRARGQAREMTGRETVWLITLFALALGCKEMAAMLPAVLLSYELIYHPPWRSATPEWLRSARPIMLLAAMAALFLAIKTLTPNEMSNNILSMYTPNPEPGFVLRNYLHHYRQLLLDPGLSAAALAAGLALTALLAAALRSREMLLGLLFANITLLPVCVISPRDGFVWYIPLFGWALYGGASLERVAGSLEALARRAPEAAQLEWLRPAMFVLLAGGWLALFYGRSHNLGAPYLPQQQAMRAVMEAARRAAPNLPAGARILLEEDPFPEVAWEPLFLLRLGYGDATLWVDRVRGEPVQDDARGTGVHDLRLHWDGASYQGEVIRHPAMPPLEAVAAPAIVHRGQSLHVQFAKEAAGCVIDAAYRRTDDELARAGVWSNWMTLDARGAGSVGVSQDEQRGAVIVDRVRACGGQWQPARLEFLIVP